MLASQSVDADVCASEPMFASARLAGLSTGPSGVLVAIWPDGRIIKAVELGRTFVQGKLSEADLLRVRDAIEESGYWGWAQPDLALDLPEHLYVACLGSRRLSR